MGRSERPMPRRLAVKLHAIRLYLDLTQKQMVARLENPDSRLYQGHISEYERGEREPPLLILLQYARAVEVSTDVLIDDHLDMPEKLGTITSSIERIKKRKRKY